MGNSVSSCNGKLCNLHILQCGGTNNKVYRKDYQVNEFILDFIYLNFIINDGKTIVESKMTLRRNKESLNKNSDLLLFGEDLKLLDIQLNGKTLEKDLYNGYYFPKGEDGSLIVTNTVLPKKDQQFTLNIRVEIEPEKNTRDMGLYFSHDLYSTQCESAGFRRITFSLDRPDVMTKFKVRVEADKDKCPVLLSNGNLVESGSVEGSDNRHFAVFVDPFVKPHHLFALVAGKLESIKDEFITMSGKKVKLFIYSTKEYVDGLSFAMASLKFAMKWDEERFGLEYDLEIFNIVAVSAFNFGAMENKSLNIFAASALYVNNELSSDNEIQSILSIVGHEYFHNWTGNRVSLRDWFQLTLKEGLTVYRDQEFSKDLCNRLDVMLSQIQYLKSSQFAEDSSPLAHPIRPESYVSTDNLYTVTVYSKGAEVIRMYETLLGIDGFRKGMDLYIARNDGKAVTCDDFRSAMADANDYDLTQFERWYDQAGTPEVEVIERIFDPDNKTFKLTFRQRCSPTPGQPKKRPFLIPIKTGLISSITGKELVDSRILLLSQQQQSFVIEDVTEEPIPSVLREFSAPINIKFKQELTDDELSTLLAFDTDEYNRYTASQSLFKRILLKGSRAPNVDQVEDIIISNVSDVVFSSFERLLNNINTSCNKEGTIDPSVAALSIAFPTFSDLFNSLTDIDVDLIFLSVKTLGKTLGERFKDKFVELFNSINKDLDKLPSQLTYTKEDGINAKAIGLRQLLNVVLKFISYADAPLATKLSVELFSQTKFMTSKLGAVSTLLTCNYNSNEANDIIDKFYNITKVNMVTLSKFFAIQAYTVSEGTYDIVLKLLDHEEFVKDKYLPERFRSLVRSFAANPVAFNRSDGLGYKLVADQIIDMDSKNPQVAADTSRSFKFYGKMSKKNKELMKIEMERILNTPNISKNTIEVISSILN